MMYVLPTKNQFFLMQSNIQNGFIIQILAWRLHLLVHLEAC